MIENNGYEVTLSVVIANYNYGVFLPLAIESIIRQCDGPIIISGRKVLPLKGRRNCVEIIICDAASTDDSVSVIRKYENYISWWCSEKDGGQSAAFNKGFAHSTGNWLTWLNSDDLYLSGSLDALCGVIDHHPEARWITGNDLHFDNDTKHIAFVAWGPHKVPFFLRKNKAQLYPFGPSSFWHRSVYDTIGPIDESLHYQMDLDYWARLTMAGIVQTRLNYICWAFRQHSEGKSTGGSNFARGKAEHKYWIEKTGYTYKNKFSNIWYDIWLIWRIFDGSLIVRAWKRLRCLGRTFDEVKMLVR